MHEPTHANHHHHYHHSYPTPDPLSAPIPPLLPLSLALMFLLPKLLVVSLLILLIFPIDLIPMLQQITANATNQRPCNRHPLLVVACLASYKSTDQGSC